jgi:hypothetical protein
VIAGSHNDQCGEVGDLTVPREGISRPGTGDHKDSVMVWLLAIYGGVGALNPVLRLGQYLGLLSSVESYAMPLDNFRSQILKGDPGCAGELGYC